MSLHSLTRQSLTSNKNKFSNELSSSIEVILELIDDYSALSDTNFLLHKYNKMIPGIELPKGEASWLPIRNIARLLAKVADMKPTETIERVEIDSMNCGCDYFEGNIFIYTENKKYGGPYKWHWTAFEDRQRHFDRFTLFPTLDNEVLIESKKI